MQRGIKSNVKKVTHGIGTSGCGYGVEIYGNAAEAAEILRRADIRVLDITGDAK